MDKVCKECRVSFLLFPESIHPDVISNILSILPTEKKVKNEFKETVKGRKFRIKRSSWFLISDSEIESKNLEDHLIWLFNKLKKIENLPCYLKKKLQELSLTPDEFDNNNIIMSIYCTWFAQLDQGGFIISAKTLENIAQINIELTFDVYFDYEYGTIDGFMEAGKLLGIGQNLSIQDWIHLLAFIKSVHNISPSTLGIIYSNGDFRDTNGQLICNIKDYIL